MFAKCVIFTTTIKQDEEIQKELEKKGIEFYAFTGNILIMEKKDVTVLKEMCDKAGFKCACAFRNGEQWIDM